MSHADDVKRLVLSAYPDDREYAIDLFKCYMHRNEEDICDELGCSIDEYLFDDVAEEITKTVEV